MTEQQIRDLIAEEVEKRAQRTEPEPEVLSAEESARFLGVTLNTVYEYANRGHIPHQRVGRRMLFSRTALVAWLGSCKFETARKG